MKRRKILSSWKEISNYLGIQVRTAQRWEKELNLPIHRIEDFKNTYVIAYADELNKWLEKKDKKNGFLEKYILKRKRLVLLTLSSAIFVLILLFVLLSPFEVKHSIPSGFEIRDSNLVILDDLGDILWSFEAEEILDRDEYHIAASNSSKSAEHINVFFNDINYNDTIDVIFAAQTKNNCDEKVVCFNQNGRSLWNLKVGREIRYGDQLISSDFDIILVRVVDLNNDKFMETVIIASHKMFFPSRVLVLNHLGKIIGEYWNSGHLVCMEFIDLDNDGHKEIILGGLNNNYLKACLIVLDSRKINGSSPQEIGTRYYAEVLESGTEKYYVLISQNELGKLLGPYETIQAIDLYENNRFQTSTSRSRVFYEFDYRLRPTYVHPGDECQFILKQLEKEGKISPNQIFIDKDQLKSAILYWNGKSWTNEPTMTDFWKKR